jgi:hypothetical protein
MKTLACTLALFLGLGITFAQNQENPDVRYHVEKEYDQNGNLIRYDSTRVTNSSKFSKKLNFFFKRDTLGFDPQIHFSPHFFMRDSLDFALDLDSLIDLQLSSLKDKLPHLDSLIHENYFPGMNNWFHDKNPELSKLNKRMEEFEKLIEKKMLRIEELLDQLDEAEKEKSKY